MATTYTSAVQELYVAYFNRPADPAGLKFWTDAVTAANGDTSAVAAAFATTPEYTATFTGMTNAQMVAAVYQNLFGRAADATGAAFWTAALDAKTITMANVVTSIAAGAQGTDATIVTDKVAAASAFTAAVDTQAEISGYSGIAANAAAKAWLSTVTDANSLTVALDPATLATTVANVVAAGTPFTVAGALASLESATTVRDNFIASIAKDVNKDGTIDTVDVTAAHDAAVTKVQGDITDTASASLFGATTTSDVVRNALITSQQTVNAKELSDAQTALSTANTNIGKVAGLSAALTTVTSAQTADDAAVKAQTAAHASYAAQDASFGITNSGTVGMSTDGTKLVLHPSAGGTDVTLGAINATTGKVTVSTADDVSDYTGLSTLVASYNAQVTSDSNVTKADATLTAAKVAVNLLDTDVSTDTVSVALTAGAANQTEAQALTAITTQINATHSGTVAAGTAPTAAQITTELSTLSQTGTPTQYHDFAAEVAAYASFTDTLTAAQNSANSAITLANNHIATFAKDVAALQTAVGNSTTVAAYQATVDADMKVLTAKGYDLITDGSDATAKSDIYLTGSMTAGADHTISLFGLQGTDSIFVGTGYTMVNGAIGDKGIVGNNAALEVFLSTDASGNAQLQIETMAFGSSATTPEVVTLHLVGVDAATLHLGTDGIITSSPATTA